ncbi:SusD/RagB family nutrient-binding outer membrane lipoprotein [Parabacteroides sp. AM08-6]|uniref:SusD/RagB family nutrient-binding outer membrane lipoprotein n=1 Tax=Parabacteroides sp. AM08-6 TaxID=2292053 RepID=UPI000F0019BD|nr:SusD/RagB family nutrient-binding outer membrane lipoprotein [Parabacteroides sp. AM08-6]RHJ85366.1 SusD/RagB family nutrient-binding outer membrane lipoprotein [Parabacteroides sp. AM08-6]
MKYRYNIQSIYFLLIFIFISCTDKFRDINTDKSGITDDEMEIDFNNLGIPLNIIQQGIYFNYDFGKGKNWPYQLMQNLNADMFSGYMHDYKPLNGGSSNSDYNLQDGWNGTNWGYTYAYILPQIAKLQKAVIDQYPSVYALTQILKVEIMHRISDMYGPIIYTHFGNEDENFRPDTQQEAYTAFFNDLEEAIHILTKCIQNKDEGPDLSKFDIMLDGHLSSWIKFANSLRMRLAIRIATAASEKGKEEFLKSLNQQEGVFEQPVDIVVVSTRNGYQNPLGEINRVWGEVYMNASMESILNGYQDPRREIYFEPCGKDAPEGLIGTYKGIRQGTCFSHLLYASHSKIYVNKTTPPILMTAAEIWFLRAEAALRGWTSEDVGSCYRNGVATSFYQWKANYPEKYLESDSIGADYIDAFDPANNIKARCLVSPKWIEEASNEIKLEKIITQKWLAIFPEGCEAWAEQRRTGYPRLFPVRFNNSKDGCIDTETMIRRLNFPADIVDTDAPLYDRLTQALGKPDNAGTRLWWDTGNNF